MKINKWPIACLFAYAALKNEGMADDKAKAIACAVASSNAVKIRAERGGMTPKKKKKPSEAKKSTHWGFPIFTDTDGDKTTAWGLGKVVETDKKYDEDVKDAINAASKGKYSKLLSKARSLMKGKEDLNIFSAASPYRKVVSVACDTREDEVDLKCMMEYKEEKEEKKKKKASLLQHAYLYHKLTQL